MAHSSELSPAMVSRGSARWVDASPVSPPLSAPGRSGVGNKHMDGSAPDGRAGTAFTSRTPFSAGHRACRTTSATQREVRHLEVIDITHCSELP